MPSSLSVMPRGSSVISACFSRTIFCIPNWPRRAVRSAPVGPQPTIRTSVVSDVPYADIACNERWIGDWYPFVSDTQSRVIRVRIWEIEKYITWMSCQSWIKLRTPKLPRNRSGAIFRSGLNFIRWFWEKCHHGQVPWHFESLLKDVGYAGSACGHVGIRHRKTVS